MSFDPGSYIHSKSFVYTAPFKFSGVPKWVYTSPIVASKTFHFPCQGTVWANLSFHWSFFERSCAACWCGWSCWNPLGAASFFRCRRLRTHEGCWPAHPDFLLRPLESIRFSQVCTAQGMQSLSHAVFDAHARQRRL